MKRLRLLLLLSGFLLYCSGFLFAETITLKNGEKITGKVITRTDRYIKLETATGPVIYFMSVITNIASDDGVTETVPVPAPVKEEVVKERETVPVPAKKEKETVSTPVPAPETVPMSDKTALEAEIEDALGLHTGITSQSEEVVLKPGFNTAKIIYEITENTPPYERRIQKVSYIDVKNNKRRDEETEIFVPGKVQGKRDELNIFDGKKYYHIDLAKGVATYLDYSKEKNFRVWTDNLEFNESGSSGSEEMLGKDCKIYESAKSKSWLWNGLLLKQISKLEGSVRTLNAISIEENLFLNEDLFKLPQSITVQLKQTPVVMKAADTSAVLPRPAIEKKEEARRSSVEDVDRILKAGEQKVSLRDIAYDKMQGEGDDARREIAKLDLENISTALELYRIDKGSYPSTKDGIWLLVGPYLDKEFKDPWARSYRYRAPENSGGDYNLYSAGPDGIDNNADDIK